MARPSKTQFAIYDDEGGIPTPDPQGIPHDDGKNTTIVHDEQELETEAGRANFQPTDTEIDRDGRRESAISSLPESSTETDQEPSLPHSMIRPSFRRHLAGSSFERSPKRLALPKSRTTTPRSTRTTAKGSPLPRKHALEDPSEAERKEYPLVLLHITILPLELRWSPANMRELLPPNTVENLQLLRSKLSETILQRGILIPHPREEYDVLEERLLEALELRKERITPRGHFRTRESISSASSAEDSVDSGLGSSVEDLCAICQDHLRPSATTKCASRQKWDIKVYAANGLMRASAWAAAWSEMERVDVEIMPWMDEALRRLLDAKAVEEEAEKKLELEEARIADEQRRRVEEEEEYQRHASVTRQVLYLTQAPATVEQPSSSPPPPPPTQKIPPSFDDLPQVYRPKDIPLSLLLRNYIILLSQDTKNIVIFVLAVLAIWFGLSVAVAPTRALPPSLTVPANVSSPLELLHETISLRVPSASIETAALESSHPLTASSEASSGMGDGTNTPSDVQTEQIPAETGKQSGQAQDPVLDAEELPISPTMERSFDESQGTPSAETIEYSHVRPEAERPKAAVCPSYGRLLMEMAPVCPAVGTCVNEAMPAKMFAKPE
ncbi:Hypothetical predicted protein [Lecanosticta acicola]|uniref:Pathway-specific nitrogen regulator n=1 Tax=Lecanosticta acicola TaxID=111012 RepID=A0AAI8YRU4_9PEZI|nr:Hypothetical predicted protein [Lecanosticta acicola]